MQIYQQPNSERSIIDTIESLAKEDSQHPPLYYIIARFWEQVFGSELAVKRSLPALISLLVFPCLYYLAYSLFRSQITAWIAVGIVAISPFQTLYAQEVREYSLWTVTILLSSWLLLRSLRLNSTFSWLIYAASLTILLYTYLFSIFILIGQAIYVFGLEKWRLTQKVIYFIIASGLSILTFFPWLSIVIHNLAKVDETTSLLQAKIPLTSLVKMWMINLSRAFIDLDSQGRIIPVENCSSLIIIIPIIIIVGYAVYFLCRHADRTAWLFILTLMGVTGLALILPDLILGGIRSSATRYLVPCYLGIQLAIAYWLSCMVDDTPCSQTTTRLYNYLWRWVAIAIIFGGVLSCAISSQADSWWNKYGSYYNPQVARIVNQAKQPLAIANAYLPRIFSLSYLLTPQAKIQFIPEANLSQIPSGYSHVFLYRPFPELQSRLKKQLNHYKIETVYQSPPVYQYLQPIAQQSKIWITKLEKP